MKCLVENCPHNAKTRGLCRNCYGMAGKHIRNGIIHSWGYLEDIGMALPVVRKKPLPRAAFMVMLNKRKPKEKGH